MSPTTRLSLWRLGGGGAERAHCRRCSATCSSAFGPRSAVIACNTASTLVSTHCARPIPGQPFVGTVPAIKPAAERTRSGLVSVLATPGTVKRQYTRDLIAKWARNAMSVWSAATRLARWPKPTCATALSTRRRCAPRSRRASSSGTAGAPTSSCSPARTIRSWSTACARPRPGRSIGSIRPRRSRGARCRCLTQGRARRARRDLRWRDLAVFTSGRPDFATRRLMQGFGLTLKLANAVNS